MKNYKEELINKINEMYGDNAPYVLKAMEQDLHMYDYYMKKERDEKFLDFVLEDDLRKADKLNNNLLTPVTVKVGDGATINYWSDRRACTIIKVTKSTIVVQEDKATLDENFKPEWIVGGFAGHCINQDEQTYTYERDTEGTTRTFHWSNKYNMYGQPNDLTLSRGRHEFYDYNF